MKNNSPPINQPGSKIGGDRVIRRVTTIATTPRIFTLDNIDRRRDKCTKEGTVINNIVVPLDNIITSIRLELRIVESKLLESNIGT